MKRQTNSGCQLHLWKKTLKLLQIRTKGFPIELRCDLEAVDCVKVLFSPQWARIRMNRMKQGPLRYGVQPLVKICKQVSYLGLMPFNSIWKKKPLTKFWTLAKQCKGSASEATLTAS